MIVRDIHRRWLSVRDNERLVREGCLAAEILGSVDTATFLESLPYCERLLPATPILHGYRAACYDIEERPRVIVPGAHLAGRKAYCSNGYRGRTVKELGVGDGAHSKHVNDCRIRGHT